jgi:hypothetical protein
LVVNKLIKNFRLRPLYPPKIASVFTQQESAWAPEPFWTFWRREIEISAINIFLYF